MVGLAALLALCTFIEIEKASHLFRLPIAGLLTGERSCLNHLVHGAGCALGYPLALAMRYPETPR
jgi:hypothetical protein